MVTIICCPATRSTSAFTPAFMSPVRISGPFVSSAMAIGRGLLAAAALTLTIVSLWYSCDPWEKFIRAMSRPAAIIFSSIGTDLQAGPIVQMIPELRWTLGGESMSSSHSDSKRVPAKADASCCSYDPSVKKVAPLVQLGTLSIAPVPPMVIPELDLLPTFPCSIVKTEDGWFTGELEKFSRSKARRLDQ